MDYIGFRRRFLAYLIDMVILFIPNVIFILAELPEISVILTVLYFSFFESSSLQATPGKIILKIKVVDEKGSKITIVNAIIRNVLKILISNLFLMFGFIMVAFTKKKQGYHDMILNTYAVSKESEISENNILYLGDGGLIRKFISVQLTVLPILAILVISVYLFYSSNIELKNIVISVILVLICLSSGIGFYFKKKWAFWSTAVVISYTSATTVYSIQKLLINQKINYILVISVVLFFVVSLFSLFREDLISSFKFKFTNNKQAQPIIFIIMIATFIIVINFVY